MHILDMLLKQTKTKTMENSETRKEKLQVEFAEGKGEYVSIEWGTQMIDVYGTYTKGTDGDRDTSSEPAYFEIDSITHLSCIDVTDLLLESPTGEDTYDAIYDLVMKTFEN